MLQQKMRRIPKDTLKSFMDIAMIVATKQRAEDRKCVSTSKPSIMTKVSKSSIQEVKSLSRQGFLCLNKPSTDQQCKAKKFCHDNYEMESMNFVVTFQKFVTTQNKVQGKESFS